MDLDAALNVEMTTATATMAGGARVDEVRTRYLRRRVELIWQAVKEVVTAGRVQYSATLAADLKAEIRKYAAPPDARAGISVAGRLEQPLKQADSDIDLFVLELKQPTGSQLPHPQPSPSHSATGPNTVIFQGPVGAVQTGPHATAHIQQRGPEDIQLAGRAASRDALISVGEVSFATDAEYYLGPQIYRRYSTHPVIGGGHVPRISGLPRHRSR